MTVCYFPEGRENDQKLILVVSDQDLDFNFSLLWGFSYFVIVHSLRLERFIYFSTNMNGACHRKTCLKGLRPDKAQTSLLSNRDKNIEIWHTV